MLSLIIPCAGIYTDKPKWFSTCPNGNLMIQESIKCLDLINIDKIYITFVKEQFDKISKNINVKELFNFHPNIIVTILNSYTYNQSETVYQTIVKNKIEGGIFIKDYDNYYNFKIEKGNYVCSLKINENNNISKLYNKSFIEINNLYQIINICEKKIISENICVGGYSFEDAKLFKKFYIKCEEIKLTKKEFYISHLIHYCMLEKIIFFCKPVNNYIDWGTNEEWFKYKNSYKTIFLDIDGVIFYNSGKFSNISWGNTEPIKDNLNYIKKLYATNKIQIILTTARSSKYRKITIDQLNKYDVPYDKIIFDLFHAKRFLINDYADSNPYPSAIAINLKRDSSDLKNISYN